MMAQQVRAKRLVAVVVTYNRLEQLRLTVARLLAAPEAELAALVVVDNASQDDTAAWLATQADPRLDVLRLAENSGGAGGFEQGMRRALAAHAPDWLVLMDDDGRPEPGALSAFQAVASKEWDGLAAAVRYPDGRICEMNRPSRNPFWHRRAFRRTLTGGRDGYHIPPEAYDAQEIRPIDVTSFVGFFVSARAVERAGYPDPGLFLYGDDGIYTLGLSASGDRIGFAPQIRFEHDCSTFTSDSQQQGRFKPLWKVYYYHRNLLIMYRIAAGMWFWPVMAVMLPKWAWKARAHAGERGTYLKILRRAVRDGLRGQTDVPHRIVVGWAEPR